MNPPHYITEERLLNVAVLPPVPCTVEFDEAGGIYEEPSSIHFRNHIRNCSACNARLDRVSNPIPPEGDPESLFVIVGRNPSSVDTVNSGIFRKDSNYGKIFELYLERLGLSRGEVYLTNSLFCPLPQNRDPHPLERIVCSLHKKVEFGFVRKARIVLLMGDDALKQFVDPSLDIRSNWDRYFAIGSRFLIPIMHVGFFLKNPHEQNNIIRHLEVIKHRFIAPVKKGIL